MKKIIFSIIFLAVLGMSCKKEYRYIYDVGSEVVYESSAEKDKQKSSSQFVSILYSNLFRSSVSQQELNELTELRSALGDKQIADNLIINNYVNSSTVQIPTDLEMRDDIPKFVEETYIRFYLRKPTPYEAKFMKESIENDPGMSPELIYEAFAGSNEYKFY
jgi:hypothetical protein